MQSNLDQARRLCVALEQLLDGSDASSPGEVDYPARTQVIVDRLAILAQDAEVRRTLREPIRLILARWQRQTEVRATHLAALRGELSLLEQGRQRLAYLALSYRAAAESTMARLQATA